MTYFLLNMENTQSKASLKHMVCSMWQSAGSKNTIWKLVPKHPAIPRLFSSLYFSSTLQVLNCGCSSHTKPIWIVQDWRSWVGYAIPSSCEVLTLCYDSETEH